MIPDSLEAWLKLLVAVPALLGAYKVPALVRWIKMRLTQALASAMLSQVMPLLTEMRTSLGEVRHQVFPNGGGSMNDALQLTLASSVRTERNVAVLHDTMRAHQDADLSQARFEADREGLFSWTSYALLRWCGRQQDQVIRYGWINCVAHPDRARVRAEWDSAIEEQREFSSRFLLTGSDGLEFLVDAFAKPIRSAGILDSAERWVGVITRVALPA